MSTEKSNKGLSNRQVLDSLLSHVKPVDFRVVSGIGEVGDIKGKHFIVATIRELLALAASLNWGLSIRNEFIYVYNGEYWKTIEPADFKGFLGDVALAMGVNKVDAQFYMFREQLFKQFLASANLSAPERPKDTVLINLNNGTFEITPEGSRLRRFEREDFLTYQLPFDYDDKATAPIFNEYLSRVLPEVELRRVLAEFIGYIFSKNLKLEKCLLLYGSGANGKSVFFEIMNALLGKENVSNFSLGNLAEEHNRALISNKLLNYGSEIRASIEKDIFKQLVSGEPVQARLKYQNSITIDDYARLCFNCNELPQDVEYTEAYFRRFLIIPFNVTIPEGERDPMLARRIISNELSGVFNWVLRGLLSLLESRRFTESNIVRTMVNSYKLESDSVYQFITDGSYKPSKSQASPFKNFYENYSIYCRESNYRPLSRRKFSDRLKGHGFIAERMGGGGTLYVYVENK